MSEEEGRISINRYAKKETKKNDKGFATSWYFWICRLYSSGIYSDREYKTEKISNQRRYTYDASKSCDAILKSENGEERKMVGFSFYIAVKELIIEWEDYQTEVSGYVHCKSCLDLYEESDLFHHVKAESIGDGYKIENNAKQLLRFVKSPGLRNTNIRINEEDLEFSPIDLNHCDTVSIREQVDSYRNLTVRREHRLECELRPLFDNEPLPIKHAHITVEFYLQ